MNIKLLLQLSLFGLIMAFGTVSLIPQQIEPIFWLVIFCFCAVVIAKAGTGKYFWHGFVLSIINSVWITAVHVLMYKSYATHHPDITKMSGEMPTYFSTHPRVAMVLMAPIFGVVFGLIQGLFAFIAAKLIKK
ncbi:hypothetical protein [Mucilaginibacter sp.]|jgi:hypothetical protein|uniref:hypothetical protein n=1 Tax=Mucilaginibacter sp. TaxID=1882438 RepID=UPI003568038A